MFSTIDSYAKSGSISHRMSFDGHGAMQLTLSIKLFIATKRSSNCRQAEISKCFMMGVNVGTSVYVFFEAKLDGAKFFK